MKKRGQITVFIIVGIVILALTGLIFYTVGNTTEQGLRKEQDYPEHITALQHYIEDCLSQAVEKGLYDSFFVGGVSTNNISSVGFEQNNDVLNIPLYFNFGYNTIPQIREIEMHVAEGSSVYFSECVGEFETFTLQGYTLESEEPEIFIDFSQQKTISQLVFPLEITSLEKTTRLSNFITELDFDFNTKYSFLTDFLDRQKEDENFFLIGDLSSQAYHNGYELEFHQQGELGSEVLLSFSFSEDFSRDPLVYNVGMLFDWDLQQGNLDEPESLVSELHLEYLEPWHITQEGVHMYQIVAHGENLTFEVDTQYVEIDPITGLVTLDTNHFENDEYWFFIKVKDVFNREVTAPFYINININQGNLAQIGEIRTLSFSVGENVSYQIPILNQENGPFFFDDTFSLFPVNSRTGVLEFFATREMIGTYSVRVDVENGFGKTWKRFGVVIE